MLLGGLDLTIIIVYFVIALAIGLYAARTAGKDRENFFLSGRNMPWWLLGFSMVATTFSTDTPNLVADITRKDGISGNWVWWAFLLTGMLTVFVYAKLWRRSGVLTDMEFYELRYSGPEAAFLRGFRAVYLGVFFNILVMASVTLAAIKIGGVMLNLSPLQTVTVAVIVTTIYSMFGGLRGVILTDFLLFITAMLGSLAAAWYALSHPQVDGLSNLLAHPNVSGKLSFFPDINNTELFLTILILPIAVQWWATWYPGGGEPGGGGYIAQRMLAAKNERHAMGATLFFSVAHYALRPWPWIIVALCSLVVFPDLAALSSAFPEVERGKLGHDLAYPAMLTFLPAGILGFVVASLAAAYMSTISTHLNWGSSYVVHDVYKRFIRPAAPEKELVLAGRVSTLLQMVIAAGIALMLQNALAVFQYMIMVGAGTGLIFILRWFWWRINAWSEITAMAVSFIVSLAFFYGEIKDEDGVMRIPLWLSTWKLPIGVAITTAVWVLVTFLTVPTSQKKLREFYALTTPGGPGWRHVREQAARDGEAIDERGGAWDVPMGILCMLLGSLAVYCALFATGKWLYGEVTPAVILTVVAIAAGAVLVKLWGRLLTRS